MHKVIELKRNLQDKKYFLSQFDKSGTEVNILYVSPPLSSKYLYKSILPAIKLPEITAGNIQTALTGIQEYSLQEQLLGYKAFESLNSNNPNFEKMVLWANVINFPFTLQPLTDIYTDIRRINPDCFIFYHVDFNYYAIPEAHPLKSIFADEMVIDFIEENIYHADSTLVNNHALQYAILDNMAKSIKTKFAGVYRDSINEQIMVEYLDTIIDSDIVLDNVDYKPSELICISNLLEKDIQTILNYINIISNTFKAGQVQYLQIIF